MKKNISKILMASLFLALSGLGYAANNDVSSGIGKRPNVKISNSAGRVTLSTEYTSENQDFRQKFIILHFTAIDKEASLRALTRTENQVSSHFLISDQEGEPIYYLVDESRRAWHAGLSAWKTRTNINDSSLGIEIVNLGNTNGYFEEFKEFQIKQVAVLVKYLADKYEIPAENILGHSDIAPQRKSDPGPLFPWYRLYAEYGIGMWYDETVKQAYQSQYEQDIYSVSAYELQSELKKFGYEISLTGQWDEQTKKVLTVFQHHFRPSNYEGTLDAETYAVLKALNAKYNSK